MSHESPLPPATVAAAARKIEEGFGILKLLGPLCKRARALTVAEQRVLQEALGEAYQVLGQAWRDLLEARYPQNGQAVQKD